MKLRNLQRLVKRIDDVITLMDYDADNARVKLYGEHGEPVKAEIYLSSTEHVVIDIRVMEMEFENGRMFNARHSSLADPVDSLELGAGDIGDWWNWRRGGKEVNMINFIAWIWGL